MSRWVRFRGRRSAQRRVRSPLRELPARSRCTAAGYGRTIQTNRHDREPVESRRAWRDGDFRQARQIYETSGSVAWRHLLALTGNQVQMPCPKLTGQQLQPHRSRGYSHSKPSVNWRLISVPRCEEEELQFDEDLKKIRRISMNAFKSKDFLP